MPAESNRARIYVSFADEDRARAMALVRWLNDSGWQVAADDRHIFTPGDHWSPPPRLDACDVILCVITPGWLVSSYCHHEFSHCAKRGKFILPVVCELSDVNLLPPAIRPLPRVDLTQNRMIDYLALKEVLTQAGPERAGAAMPESPVRSAHPPSWMPRKRHPVALALAAAALAALALVWLWAKLV